jgi:hypothetical protein
MLKKLLTIFIFLLLLPFVIPVLALYGLYGLILHLYIWLTWSIPGRRILFVYSNSPVWKDYIEAEILPRLPKTGLVLNWSEPKEVASIFRRGPGLLLLWRKPGV